MNRWCHEREREKNTTNKRELLHYYYYFMSFVSEHTVFFSSHTNHNFLYMNLEEKKKTDLIPSSLLSLLECVFFRVVFVQTRLVHL